MDVGIIYECAAMPLWELCKYYEDDPHTNFCKWYGGGFAQVVGCSCKEARAEADMNVKAKGV